MKSVQLLFRSKSGEGDCFKTFEYTFSQRNITRTYPFEVYLYIPKVRAGFSLLVGMGGSPHHQLLAAVIAPAPFLF